MSGQYQGKHTEYILGNAKELGENAVETLTGALGKHLAKCEREAAPANVDYVESMTEALTILQSQRPQQ